MEDTIEICTGCGKMPRSIDNCGGTFVCSRCGNRSTMQVSGDNYEKIVTELDKKFHARILQTNFQAAAKEPVIKAKKGAKAKAAKKVARKPVKKAAAPAKKKKKK